MHLTKILPLNFQGRKVGANLALHQNQKIYAQVVEDYSLEILKNIVYTVQVTVHINKKTKPLITYLKYLFPRQESTTDLSKVAPKSEDLCGKCGQLFIGDFEEHQSNCKDSNSASQFTE